MALIRLDPKVLIPYVPIFERDNKTDPLTIHVRYMPAVVYDDYMRALASERESISSMAVDRRLEVTKLHDKDMFLSHVKKVENFLDDDKKPIEDISVFYESIDNALRGEILTAISSQSRLDASQIKN